MRVQNRIFISQVFEMEVSDGGWRSGITWFLWKYYVDMQTWKPRGFHGNHAISKKICLYIARVLTGARVLRSLYVFRVQNEHSMVSVQNSIFIGEVFQIKADGPVHSLGSSQKVNVI